MLILLLVVRQEQMQIMGNEMKLTWGRRKEEMFGNAKFFFLGGGGGGGAAAASFTVLIHNAGGMGKKGMREFMCCGVGRVDRA